MGPARASCLYLPALRGPAHAGQIDNSAFARLPPRGAPVPWGLSTLCDEPCPPDTRRFSRGRRCRAGLRTVPHRHRLALAASGNVPAAGLALHRVIVPITALAPALRGSSSVTFKGNSGTSIASETQSPHPAAGGSAGSFSGRSISRKEDVGSLGTERRQSHVLPSARGPRHRLQRRGDPPGPES